MNSSAAGSRPAVCFVAWTSVSALDFTSNRFKWLSLALLRGEKFAGGAGPPDAAGVFVVKRAKTVRVLLSAIAVVLAVLAFDGDAAFAQASNPSAGDMLQDGLEALADRDSDEATQVFEQLILAFPGTSEAERAERELRILNASKQAAADQQARSSWPHDGEDIAALRMRFATEAGDRVFFAEDSAVIGGRARALLENQARWLASQPDLKITIIGRADDGGPENEAHLLSAKRAEAVRDKLLANGVAVSRIMIDARGARDPIATCGTPMCQAQNRQAETSIGGAVITGAGDDVVRGVRSHGLGAPTGGTGDGVTVSR
jgi:peptidoglycan-associated lipoprotein